MSRAIDLLRQGRTEELWQMCCGFTGLSIKQFMAIQESLLLEQIHLLEHSVLGRKLMQGARPDSIDDFRRLVPLTTYQDYCPELPEKRADLLPAKPVSWVHTSGRSGEFPCKWVPFSEAFSREMSRLMYGIGILSGCKQSGDVSRLNTNPKIVYTVAPRPYVSGEIAAMIGQQIPSRYLPDLDEAESLPFEERIKLGFQQALTQGFDYFFGLSLVLVTVGNRFNESTEKVDIRPYLKRPRALFRLGRGMMRSKMAHRRMLPKDLWSVKGIISSGLDSGVYKDKIKELWGRRPLDVYIGTEAGLIATQTWDYEGMTFIPDLNFLEFIPEKEHMKWQLDRSYQPGTVLMDEVKAGENYELVITNFHGGAMVRYRIGDMVKITALRNEKLGIDIPQMAFERRADGLIDFVFVRLTEKTLWQSIESSGVPYEDWTAYKVPGEPVLRLLIEVKEGYHAREADISGAVFDQVMKLDSTNQDTKTLIRDDFAKMINFRVETTLLPKGSFARYMAQRQAEGADLAHLKPPHVNPPEKVLALLLAGTEAEAPVTVAPEKVPA